MTAWIFKGTPDVFDVTGYVQAVNEVRWTVNQLRKSIKVGDAVYLYQSKGKRQKKKGGGGGMPRDSGIVGLLIIRELPKFQCDAAQSLPFYLKQADRELAAVNKKWRVDLLVVTRCDFAPLLSRDELLKDEICKSLADRRETNIKLTNDQASQLEFLISKQSSSAPTATALENEFGASTEEGQRRQRLHLRLERNRGIVAKAKWVWAEKNPDMPCEICQMSFVQRYGEHGRDFIEAHHRKPLGELAADQTACTRIEDLAPVCANCHRMLHANGGLSIPELIERLNTPRPSRAP